MRDFEGSLGIYRSNDTSYEGEDGVLFQLFTMIGEGNKYCVEFGARDGKTASNTYNLIFNHGWSGLQIEADPYEASALHENYASRDDVTTLTKYVTTSGLDTLDKILQQVGAPSEPDLLVVDIDSTDYLVWKSLKDFSPRVVMIEHNDTMPLWLDYYEKDNQPVHTGSSLLALARLAREKGYQLVYSHKVNAIFVRVDVCKEFNLKTIDIEVDCEKKLNCIQGAYNGYFCFSAYDGSLVLLNLHDQARIGRKKINSYAHWKIEDSELVPLPSKHHSFVYKLLRKILHSNKLFYLSARRLHSYFS